MARPSSYEPKVTPILARYWAREGKIDAEIAELLGVTERTINNWKKRYPEFLQALKENKIVADANVVTSLYKRATGFEYEETEITVDAKKKRTRIKRTKKLALPDVTAGIYWTKNRLPHLWRDHPQGLNPDPSGGLNALAKAIADSAARLTGNAPAPAGGPAAADKPAKAEAETRLARRQTPKRPARKKPARKKPGRKGKKSKPAKPAPAGKAAAGK